MIGREKVSTKQMAFHKKWWCIWKFRGLQSKKENTCAGSVWWYDADIQADKNMSPLVTELFLRGTKFQRV